MKISIKIAGKTIGAILWPEAWLLGFIIGFGGGWRHRLFYSRGTKAFPDAHP